MQEARAKPEQDKESQGVGANLTFKKERM